MEAERLADDVRQHCHIQLKNKTSDRQKVIIENVEAKWTKWGKQLVFPLDTKMATI